MLDGPQGRLRPRRKTELAEDVRHVRARGALRDEQLGPDLLVGHALAEEPHDVLLAVGKRLDGFGVLLRAHPLRQRKDAEPIEPLTTREKEVLSQLAKGASNKEIAYELGITERTARTHVSNILGKLGLASRTQAALYAVEHKLV